MDWQSRIPVDPWNLMGKPVIRATQQILESYPHNSEEDIRACLAYAGELLREERVHPLTNA